MFVQSRKYSTMVVTMHQSAVTGVVWCQAMYRYGTAREKSAETESLAHRRLGSSSLKSGVLLLLYPDNLVVVVVVVGDAGCQ